MQSVLKKTKRILTSRKVKKTFKTVGYFFLGTLSLILISAIVLRIYFENHKTEIVEKINTQINETIQGEVKIGDIGYKFLIGFPNFTVVLKDVELKDSLISIHKRPVLKAKEIEVRLNVLKLVKKEVNIHKIVIIDAKIDLFKDKNGLTNSNLFKPKKKKDKIDNTTKASLDKIILKNVVFISENQQGNKVFHFEIKSLKSQVDYEGVDWKTEVHLQTFAKSLAFNSQKGSFVKDKEIEGTLSVLYSAEQNKISVHTTNLEIGKDRFKIKAQFHLGKKNSLFAIAIQTQIKWSNAAHLLSDNISSKLNKFDLKKPLSVQCVIKGDMSVKGDPEITVDAEVNNNQLTTTYGTVEDCSFKGKFTNNYQKGLGLNDINSAIVVSQFSGNYNEIPIQIPVAVISNLEKPLATGQLYSEYEISKLNSFFNEEFITFLGGKAKVNLDFKVDIVDVKLHKPKFTGAVVVKNASLFLKSKNVTFNRTDIDLYFTDRALLIKKLTFKDKANSVFMEGRINNFLNLYYDAPEKMLINWKVYSPYLDIKQIVNILTYSNPTENTKPKKKNSNAIELHEVVRKSQVSLDMKVDKLTYKKMTATNFKVNILMAKKGLFVKNVSVQGASGSTMSVDAKLIPQGKTMAFATNIKIKEGTISKFLASFNNFGIQSFRPKDINGDLSLSTSLQGKLDANRDIDLNSIKGSVHFLVENGGLSNFEPLIKIGKVAFPRRNVKQITFSELKGDANLNGNLIQVNELKVTSNVLNIDVKGTYSLTHTGTELAVKIPLRNPKEDFKIKDTKNREELRNKGIVLNLMVVDGKNGQTKIKLGKPKE